MFCYLPCEPCQPDVTLPSSIASCLMWPSIIAIPTTLTSKCLPHAANIPRPAIKVGVVLSPSAKRNHHVRFPQKLQDLLVIFDRVRITRFALANSVPDGIVFSVTNRAVHHAEESSARFAYYGFHGTIYQHRRTSRIPKMAVAVGIQASVANWNCSWSKSQDVSTFPTSSSLVDPALQSRPREPKVVEETSMLFDCMCTCLLYRRSTSQTSQLAMG